MKGGEKIYQTIYELPSQVRSSLDEKDQKVFLDAYNEVAPQTEEETKKALKKAWRACKDLPSSFSFNIIATVEDVDKDRDIIDVDSVKKHMDSFMSYGGNIQDDHGNYQLGVIWDWNPVKVEGMDGVEVWGNLFGGDEVYDHARRAFVKGTNNLSIAGEANRGRFQCDEKGCYTRRDVKQLLEISLCKVPANKHCTLKWYNDKAKFTKSAEEGLRLNVTSYNLHKDRENCPIHLLKHDLCAIGYDAHARPEGVYVAMSRGEYEQTLPIAKSHGLAMEWTGDGALFQERDKAIEKAFKSYHGSGAIDVGGHLTMGTSKNVFRKLYDSGLLVQDGDEWRLDHPRS